ncbi:hypothetical protein ACNQGX_18270, partial [Flavobacterium sp. ZB4P13]
ALTAANNGQTLQITGITTTSATPNCSQAFTQNVTLSVNPSPTLTGAAQAASVCVGSGATINLTGLLASSTSTVAYTINGVAQTAVTGVVANGSGASSFTSAALTAANNGQTLQITGITTTSATPNCSQAFTQNVTLSVNPSPTNANAGADQTGALTCGLTTVTLAGNVPTVGTGKWTIVSGVGGSFALDTDPTTTFSGTAGTAYTLRWTISNTPCTASSDDVNVTFNRNPTVSNAGPDQTGAGTCGLTTVTLGGNAPAVGTGAWTITSGAGGTVTMPTSATSTFTGTAGTTYTLRWTISNAPCTASSDDVNVTFNQNPTASNAGADQTGAGTCGLTTVTLGGNAPAVGTGAWTITSGAGGTVTTPTSATSTFTGTAGTAYTLRWTISNAPCTASSDDVNVTFNQNPTASNAGADQTGAGTCGLTTVTLAGNAPAVGTGAWTITSGAGGTVTTPTSATSTFTGTAGTAYTLRWTISNAPCTASSDDVNVTFNRNPTVSITGVLTACLTTTLTAVTDAVSPNYIWYKNDVVIGGETASTLVVTEDGDYKVKVINGSTSCEQTSAASTVKVEDKIAPTFTKPADINIFSDATCSYVITPVVTGDVTNETDNCSTGLQAAFADVVVNGSCQGSKIITRTWSLVDGSGNAAADQIQTITIEDTTVPSWTTVAAALNSTIQCSDAAAITAAQALAPVATDNCGTVSYTKTAGLFVAGSCANTGTYTNTWVANDVCSNTSATFTQVIT